MVGKLGAAMFARELFHIIAHAQSLAEVKRKVELNLEREYQAGSDVFEHQEIVHLQHWNKVQGCKMCGKPKPPAK